MSHTASPGVPKKSARQHFEEFGLSIPFVKHGQKLLHARSTEELETKSIIDLKRIVNSHYGKKGPKLIKSLVTKTAIAAWIERVETLALGPHPESRLPSTERDDIVKELGFKAPAPRKKPVRSRKAASSEEVASKPPPTHFSPEGVKIKAEPVKKGAPPASLPPLPSPKDPIATETEKLLDSALEPAQPTNERKHHDEASLLPASSPPFKKPKTTAVSPVTSHSPPRATSEPARPPLTEDKPRTSSPSPLPRNPFPPGCPSPPCSLTLRPSSTSSPTVTSPSSPPFLKPGRHGRHGDFTNDPDLLTGRGHQVTPSDWATNLRYQSHRAAFYLLHPYYPYVDRERTRLEEWPVEGLEELRRFEVWMRGYREKYPGEVVQFMWDCGCVKPRDPDESDESDGSEEE